MNICNENNDGTRAINYVKNNWNALDNGTIEINMVIDGPRFYIFGYKNGKWGAVIILSYFEVRPIYLTLDNDRWREHLWL